MKYLLNSNGTFLSENFISIIIKDSINNKSTFMEIATFLKADHILHVRYIRRHQKTNQINYSGTLTEDEINNILESKSLKDFPHLLTDTNIFTNHSSIEIQQHHSSFNDLFIFDIAENYINNLNQTNKYLLYERLHSLVNYLYIRIISTVNIGIKGGISTKRNNAKKINSVSKLCENFKITNLELTYLNAISLTGSSKEIARAINKSPRTIEKVIQNLLNKLEIKNKTQLQIKAKIITSHINDFSDVT
ncbi:LuxR C-terminal-related transcriptional regulator [Francisellaceae bacterium]|nr:LuxR C-terminal-related transcriptional regulator [Francisellaceae bacterium]